MKTAMEDFKEHEESRKRDTTKETQSFSSIEGKGLKLSDFPNKESRTVVLRQPIEVQKEHTENTMKSGKQYTNKTRCLAKR